MRVFLLRVAGLLGLLLSLGGHSARATHLLGGELTYQYLDATGPAAAPYRYRLSLVVYYNADPLTSQIPNGRATVLVGLYDAATGLLLQQMPLPRIQNTIIKPATTGVCPTTEAAVQVRLNRFEATVNLPATPGGYYAFYSETARNVDITNLAAPDREALTLYADLAPPSLPNSSPIFADTAVAVICQGDTTIIVNNAYDADGDRLEYSFGTPYGGAYRNVRPAYFQPPPALVSYAPAYSVRQPFGPTGYAFLNQNTGLSRYSTPTLGKFVVAVDVREYRRVNGRDSLIGTTRRDVQLVARRCEANQAPVFASGAAPTRPYEVAEGQPLALGVRATDPEGQRLTLRASSVLLDGPNGFAATFNNDPGTVPAGAGAGYVLTSGAGAVAGAFRFVPACGSARAQPYDLVVTATDNGCPSKSVAAIYQVLVVAASASTPDTIAGSTAVCPRVRGEAYSILHPKNTAYQWTVTGGTIAGGQGTGSITVDWGPGPADATVTVMGQSAVGCPAVVAVLPVHVNPVPGAAPITGPARVCPESLTGLRYALAGLPGSSYEWTVVGGTITSGQGTGSITVDFGADAAAKTVRVVETSRFGCVGPATTLLVRPEPAGVGLVVASVSLTNDRQVQLTFRVPDTTDDDQRVVVQRRPAGSAAAFARVGDAPATATSFTDATADTDAQTYEYRLVLTNACGTELLSSAHTLIHTTALATPAAGGRSEGSVRVQWSAYQGFAVRQYAVYRVADQGAATLVATVPGTTLETALTTSAAGFNQCFRVQALGADARVSYSNDACVAFDNKLLLYNVITPNGDGLNDVFYIDNVALYPGNSLTIFDRWGKQVYAARDYRNTWGGERAGPGTHYYLFRLADGTQYKGWFEIVK